MKDAVKTDDINVKEALERLSLPNFFNDTQRFEAYYVIMQSGNAVQKILAEKTVEQYPLAEIFATT